MSEKVAAILNKRYPSYQEPVKQAWAWNRDATSESLKYAEELARALKDRYPHVLQVRYELAFSLVRQQRRPEAIQELNAAGGEFPVLDEDCVSLLGRCHKDEGDEHLRRDFLAGAERAYHQAQENYEKAFEIRQDRFPGINIAGLQLIRASLLKNLGDKEPGQADQHSKQADDLLARSKEMARSLLSRRELWKERLPDDNIWIPATEAEAHLLLQDWQKAEQLYRHALAQPNLQAYHPETMKTQVQRFHTAYRRLEIVPQGELADPEAFFKK